MKVKTSTNKHGGHTPHHEEPIFHPEPRHKSGTIISCGTGTGTSPLSCHGSPGSQPIVIATVTLDTSELIKPTVKIDFSSLISFKTNGCDWGSYFLRFDFRLNKVCSGGNPIPLGIWTFERAFKYPEPYLGSGSDSEPECAQVDHEIHFGPVVQETDSFCFNWCECDDCSDCCRYYVELIDQQCFNIEFATITNISISALASGTNHSHYF